MERRSWLWRRKSSEKSPGETESSGSLSSLSGRFSDEQDPSRASPNHTQSPEVSSKFTDGESKDNVKSPVAKPTDDEVSENVKNLTEKLSAALLNISAKEDLVKQHARVAEEAVSGWEKAEKEVVTLKQQLEAAAWKNSALEERVVHLDGALKECVRQLRQSREDQDQKIHEALLKKAREWESSKLEFENQLSELQTQLQAAKETAASAEHELQMKLEAAASAEHELQLKLEAAASAKYEVQRKLEAADKENSILKVKLHDQAEELEVRTLEQELSTQMAETASKQHLESIKKVAKLEAECRRLRAVVQKASSVNDQKHISGSPYAESLIDSRSHSGERSLAFEIDAHNKRSVELSPFKPSRLDSWASALIVELDHFKSEKPIGRNSVSSSIDANIMDDFLEMERLAAMPDAENDGYHFDPGAGPHQTNTQNNQLKAELEVSLQRIAELEGKVQMLDDEKVRLEMELAERKNQLDISRHRLLRAEDELEELQKQLQLANECKQTKELEAEAANSKRKAVELQVEQMDAEVLTLRSKLCSLEGQIGEEQALSAEVAAKCRTLEIELEESRKQLQLANQCKQSKELEAEAANSKRKDAELRLQEKDAEVQTLLTKVRSLEGQIGEEGVLLAEFSAKCRTLEIELEELQKQLQLANQSKQAKELEAEAANSKRKVVELQLQEKDAEVQALLTKVCSLEGQIGEERAVSAEFLAKYRTLGDEQSKRKQEVDQRRVNGTTSFSKLKQEELVAAQKLAECQKTIASLGRQLKSLATLDDFLLDPELAELNGGSTTPGGGELSNSYFPKIDKEPAKIINSCNHQNGLDEKPLPPSNLSTSANPAPEKMRNGLGKLFSRTKKGSACIENN